MTEIIQQSVTLKADPDRIWRALTNKSDLAKWWSEGVLIEPEIGGVFREPWIDSEGENQLATGRILSARKDKELSFTWHEKEWPPEWETECSIKIEDKGPERVLTITHEGWEHFPDEKRDALIHDFRMSWLLHLKELKAYVDLGH